MGPRRLKCNAGAKSRRGGKSTKIRIIERRRQERAGAGARLPGVTAPKFYAKRREKGRLLCADGKGGDIGFYLVRLKGRTGKGRDGRWRRFRPRPGRRVEKDRSEHASRDVQGVG